ncbi:hypothetical protein WJX77_001697 [Trebouxia sp. C0004]
MRLSASEVVTEFAMQHPIFIAAEDSDNDMTDMEEDLHLANVNVDKTTPDCQAPQVAAGKQLASQPSAQAAVNAPAQLAAFETITQGIVEGLQDVPGISCAMLDSFVHMHYPGVKKALLTPSAAFTGSVRRLNTSGFIQAVSGPAPLGFAKVRYEPTKKAGVAPAREIAKIVAWVDKLASKPRGKEPNLKETKWRQRAADAIVLHCMHALLEWGGVHFKVLKQTLKKLDHKHQVRRCLSLNMKTVDCVVSDLVQRGVLEWGGASLTSKAQPKKPEACNIMLRCMHPVSLSELLKAYSDLDLDLPDHVASVALDQLDSNEAPNGHPTHPEPAQTEPRDATAVDTGSLTTYESSSQHSVDAVLTKKKTETDGSDPSLKGLLLSVEEDRGPAIFLPPRLSAPKPPPHPSFATIAAAWPFGQAAHHGTTGGEGPPAALTHPSRRTQPQMAPEPGSVVFSQSGHMPPTAPAAPSKPLNAPIPGLARRDQDDQLQLIQPTALAGGPIKPSSRIEAWPVQPSNMHQALADPNQMQQPQRAQHAVHADAQQPADLETDAVSVLRPPSDTTWIQAYAGDGMATLGQGNLLQPSAPDYLLHAPEPSCQQGSLLLLPPALAHLDPHNRHWVPTLLPVNPFRIAQLAHRSASSGEMHTQHTPDPNAVSVTIADQTNKKHVLDHNPGAAASKKRRLASGSASAAASVPDVHSRHTLHDQYPAQLTTHDQGPEYPHDGALLQDHRLQEPWGISESNPGFCLQPEEFPQQPQFGNMQRHSQDPAAILHHQQPSSTDSRLHLAYADDPGQHPGQTDWHQQHVVGRQQYANEQQAIGQGQRDSGNGQHANGNGQLARDSGQHAKLNGQYADAKWQQNSHDQLEQHQHGGRSKAMPQQQGAGKSRLHGELMQFCALAAPTEVEQQAVSDAVEAVTNVAKAIWPHSHTVLFGSQATTLALPGSDLDIVILGVSENITNAASGFSKMQRDLLGELLEDLLEAFKTINLLKGKAKIIDARVPIIKCTLDFGCGLAADISLGAANGAAAVQYVCQMIAAAPPLRVLVLVIKALLKETMLNEVFTGGLSSYSIVNMVMTHLLCMGYKQPDLPGPAGTGPGLWGSLEPAPEQPEEDAGDLLISFFERFGAGFDYSRHAVSVGQGGVVEKKREWKQAERPWLLAVEDPQQLGKDIGSGSFNIRNVQQLFAAAASTLRDCPDNQTEQDQWAAVQSDGASSNVAVESFEVRFPLLSELIVVETAVGRHRSAAKKRQQQAKQAPHQTRLSVLASHTRLKHHLSLSSPAAPVKPSFHVGKKGKKPVTLQVVQGESKRQKKKGKAKKAREKARAHLHRPQTKSQDATPVALPSGNGGSRGPNSSMQVTDIRDHFPPAAPQPKRQKMARKAQRQAERSAVTIPHAATKNQKRKAKKANSHLEQASQSSSGQGHAVKAGGVSKKKGGKFANRNKK